MKFGLPLRGGGRRFPPATFIGIRRKIEPKEIPSCLIPRLLVVFTRQLEILLTTLEASENFKTPAKGRCPFYRAFHYKLNVLYRKTYQIKLVQSKSVYSMPFPFHCFEKCFDKQNS